MQIIALFVLQTNAVHWLFAKYNNSRLFSQLFHLKLENISYIVEKKRKKIFTKTLLDGHNDSMPL